MVSEKSYFASKEKNLLRLSKYAVKMNMEKSLKLYTEVLLWKQMTILNNFKEIDKFKNGVYEKKEVRPCIVAQLSRQKFYIFIINWYGW